MIFQQAIRLKKAFMLKLHKSTVPIPPFLLDNQLFHGLHSTQFRNPHWSFHIPSVSGQESWSQSAKCPHLLPPPGFCNKAQFFLFIYNSADLIISFVWQALCLRRFFYSQEDIWQFHRDTPLSGLP